MTTHQLANRLLLTPDRLISLPLCRWCQQPVNPQDSIVTGATTIGEGCFSFHKNCLNNLPPEAAAETNKLGSSYFKPVELVQVVLPE